MNNIHRTLKILSEDILYEYANLDYRHTGLSNIVVHVYSQDDSKKLQHGPRVKVSNVYGKYSVSDNFVIDVKNKTIVEGQCKLTRKELANIIEWIQLNHDTILEYWNSEGEMITIDLYDKLERINK